MTTAGQDWSQWPHLPGATRAWVPFDLPVPPPGTQATDAPIVCIQVNEAWIPYILGACVALLHDATWRSSDPAVVKATVGAANDVMAQIMNYAACTEDCSLLEFRTDPESVCDIQYTIDGSTWLAFPDVNACDVILNPTTAGRNTIQTHDTVNAIEGVAENAPWMEVTAKNYPAVELVSGLAIQPVLYMFAGPPDAGTNMIEVQGYPPGAGIWGIVNAYGQIMATPVATLPTPNAYHLGAIVQLPPTGTLSSELYTCVQNPDLSFSWLNLTEMVFPIVDASLIRPSPADSRNFQYSNDGGVTWIDLCVSPTFAVKNEVETGENVIHSIDTQPLLTLDTTAFSPTSGLTTHAVA